MREREALEFVRTHLAGTFEIRRIVLFGSRATGYGSPESDWDILVIVNSAIPFIERQGVALACLGRHRFAVDLLVYTPEEAAAAARVPGSAVYWAEREGKVAYAS